MCQLGRKKSQQGNKIKAIDTECIFASKSRRCSSQEWFKKANICMRKCAPETYLRLSKLNTVASSGLFKTKTASRHRPGHIFHGSKKCSP